MFTLDGWMMSSPAMFRVKAIYFAEKNYVDTSTTPFLKKCHLSSRKILDTVFPKNVQFSLSKQMTCFNSLQLISFINKTKSPARNWASWKNVFEIFFVSYSHNCGLVQLKDSTSYHQTKHRWKWYALFFRVGTSQLSTLKMEQFSLQRYILNINKFEWFD